MIPGWGLRSPVPHGHKKQNLNSRSNIVTNSVKTLKMVHIKKKKKKLKKKNNSWLGSSVCLSFCRSGEASAFLQVSQGADATGPGISLPKALA